jgi:SAM-dependent methyltransferase
VLTVDYRRLAIEPGMLVLDLGCGEGRHTFEAYRRGSRVVSLDLSRPDLHTTRDWCAAIAAEGEAPAPAGAGVVAGDLRRLPFPDATFDRVIASEVLEHIPQDELAIAELVRVLRPGGLAAVTVPAWWPERICWALSEEYHANEGGHVRIYRRRELAAKLRAAGAEVTGRGRAHALHSPYWWLKCAVGPTNDDNPLVQAYLKLLTWDIMKAPKLTRWTEKALDPVLGKSTVLYLRRPAHADG